ncbi:MAG: hypothetical protein OEY89_05020 [Gammaproteobacteria bacterium]|nr:hypothetical protein [Gammaproteobacteria bacterium]
MNDNHEISDKRAANMWLAIVLGAIAFAVALMPFFYLTGMSVPS